MSTITLETQMAQGGTRNAEATGGGRAATLTTLGATLGFFVVTLDAVIVNVALPTIRNSLGGGITGLQWVVDGYTLAFAALLLTAGAVSDRVGAKRALIGGLLGFVAASLACGLAPVLPVLLGARVVQGAAAAAIMPSSLALLRETYADARRRAHAVAVWAMGGAVASSCGPVLGGLLALLSWRWIFLVNLPVGLLAILLLRGAPRSPQRPARLDYGGQLTGILAVVGLAYAAVQVGESGPGDARVLAALGVAVVSGVAFVLWERRTPAPMLPLALLRHQVVAAAIAVGFAFMVGYYGLPFVMSLFLQQQRGLSSLATGAVFLPMMLIGLVLTPLIPHVTHRTGERPVIVAGLISMAAGLVALALAPATLPLPAYAALMVLVGLGGPTIAPPITARLLEAVEPALAGTASGLLNTSRQLGGALAVAAFGGLLNLPGRFVLGERLSLGIAAAVAIAAALVALRSLGRETT